MSSELSGLIGSVINVSINKDREIIFTRSRFSFRNTESYCKALTFKSNSKFDFGLVFACTGYFAVLEGTGNTGIQHLRVWPFIELEPRVKKKN